jgi:hypothetical protein
MAVSDCAQPLPICNVGGSRRSKRGVAAELVKLVCAARDQRPPELPRSGANVEIAQGKGNPRCTAMKWSA